jgi:quercetin 2,3-dioxygenase
LRKNKIQTVASGFKKNGELYIHQDAAISLASIEKNKSINYPIMHAGNGAYIMVIEGSIEINGEILMKRDAIGVSEIKEFPVKANDNSEILIIEVPMA